MQKRIDKEYLVHECCQRCLGAKAEATAIAAKRRSEFEALLKEIYSPENEQRLYEFAARAAIDANEDLAHLARELGMFRSNIQLISECDVEHPSKNDRQWAERKIARRERQAAAQIEHASIDALIRLKDESLTPDEAAALVQAIPSAAELVPELKREDLQCGVDSEGFLGDEPDLTFCITGESAVGRS